MGPLEYLLLYIVFMGSQVKLAAFILGGNSLERGVVGWAVCPGEHDGWLSWTSGRKTRWPLTVLGSEGTLLAALGFVSGNSPEGSWGCTH